METTRLNEWNFYNKAFWRVIVWKRIPPIRLIAYEQRLFSLFLGWQPRCQSFYCAVMTLMRIVLARLNWIEIFYLMCCQFYILLWSAWLQACRKQLSCWRQNGEILLLSRYNGGILSRFSKHLPIPYFKKFQADQS